MLIALLSALLAQSPVANPAGPIFSSPSTSGSLAFFEFAPANGRGMTAACACTTPTGAKGEAMTFTRTGAATCSKQGLATTGIANGDLVVCSNNNEPRVEPSGGVLGLRVESARTNLMLRSQELNNAAWTKEYDAAPRTPTVTANQATAPDGTLTADYFDSIATTGAQFSDAYQLGAAGSSTTNGWECSVYVKGVSGSGTTDLCVYSGGAAWDCGSCSFVSTSWTRCEKQQTSGVVSLANRYCKLGNNSSQNGGVARSRSEMYVWGFQGEETFFPTSYIPTVAASATRNGELAGFAVSVPTTAGVCTAASVQVPSTDAFVGGAGLWAPQLSSGTANANAASPYMWPFTAVTGGQLAIDAAGSSGAPVSYSPALDNAATSFRAVAGHNGTAYTYTFNGTTRTAGPASTWSSPTYASIKLFAQTTTASAALWSRVQVDPSPSRCTP